MKNKQNCVVCGKEEKLKLYTNINIKTKGYDVPFEKAEKAWVCDNCKNRIRNNTII